jgi:hypothetical protein
MQLYVVGMRHDKAGTGSACCMLLLALLLQTGSSLLVCSRNVVAMVAS